MTKEEFETLDNCVQLIEAREFLLLNKLDDIINTIKLVRSSVQRIRDELKRVSIQ